MTDVTREQFEWDGDKLTHVPTGARFNRKSTIANFGRAGETLENGESYEHEDIRAMAHQLVLESNGEK